SGGRLFRPVTREFQRAVLEDFCGCRCSTLLAVKRKRLAFHPAIRPRRLRGTTHPKKQETPPAFCPNLSVLRSAHAGRTGLPASRAVAVRLAIQTSARTNRRLRDEIGTTACLRKG